MTSCFGVSLSRKIKGIAFIGLCLNLGLSAQAALTWDAVSAERTAKIEDSEIVVPFTFTNEGAEEVTIIGVKTTCGCTVATLAKKVFAPGEKGEIETVFTLGMRTGKQTKQIVVTTSDAPTTPTVLTLTVNIPFVPVADKGTGSRVPHPMTPSSHVGPQSMLTLEENKVLAQARMELQKDPELVELNHQIKALTEKRMKLTEEKLQKISPEAAAALQKMKAAQEKMIADRKAEIEAMQAKYKTQREAALSESRNKPATPSVLSVPNASGP